MQGKLSPLYHLSSPCLHIFLPALLMPFMSMAPTPPLRAFSHCPGISERKVLVRVRERHGLAQEDGRGREEGTFWNVLRLLPSWIRHYLLQGKKQQMSYTLSDPRGLKNSRKCSWDLLISSGSFPQARSASSGPPWRTTSNLPSTFQMLIPFLLHSFS